MAALSWQGDWVKRRGRLEWGFESYRTLATGSGESVAKAHVSFFILIINPAPACAHRVETPGVRLSRCAAERKLKPTPSTFRTVFLRLVMCIKGQVQLNPTSFCFFPPWQRCELVPVHLRLVSSLLEELSSLQSKFSSQNSANHTFLRLFSSVSPVKYSSNPGNGGKEKGEERLILRTQLSTWRK